MKFRTSHRFLTCRATHLLAISASLAFLLSSIPQPGMAATLYWDSDGDASTATGGKGPWDTTSLSWRNGSSIGGLQAWSATNGAMDIADFGGAPNTVTLNTSLSTLGLVFEVGGYTLGIGSKILSLGTGGISTVAGTTSIASAANGGVALTGAQTWNLTSGSSLNVSARISNTGSLTKIGAGTLTLTGENTYTGTTTINRGTIDLGGSASSGSISTTASGTSTAGALILGGGTLNYTRTSGGLQTFPNTILNPGASGVTVAASGSTLDLGTITRKVGGTAEFNGPAGTIDTGTGATFGSIIGGYATFGKYDWATKSGSSVVALSSTDYREYNNVAGWSNNVGGKDVTDGLGTGGPGYDGSSTASVTINSLRFNEGNADSTVNINSGSSLTVSSGGILVTPYLGIKYARINGGRLTTSTTDLVIQQNNTGTGHLQIGSLISGSGGLTKSGVGALDLSGSDATYTGVTTINGGTVTLTASITATSNVTLNNSGTLLLAANDRINNSATVTLNGGMLNLGGMSEGAAGASGVGALTLTSTSTLDYGTMGASNLIQFAGVGTHTAGLLAITDYDTGTTADHLYFAGTASDFTSLYGQSDVSFNGALGYSTAQFNGYYEIVPVPEPATWAVGILTLAATGWKFRRRKISRAA